MSGQCDRKRPSPRPRRAPAPPAPRFRVVVELSREEVFEACGRLALAHQALLRAGEQAGASELALVFELLERRVVA